MWSAVRLYSETSGNSKAMAAKNAHPTMATVAISLSRRGSTRIVDADTVLPSLGNSLPALLNDTPARTNVPLSRVYSPNHVEGVFSEVELPLYGVLRRVMCNELDQQVRQVTKRPAERSVHSLGAGIRCDLGRQARQQPAQRLRPVA